MAGTDEPLQSDGCFSCRASAEGPSMRKDRKISFRAAGRFQPCSSQVRNGLAAG